MSEVLNLYRLQQLDHQIDRITSRLTEIDKALSDDRRVVVAQKKVALAQKNSKDKQALLKKIENDVEDQQIKRKLNQASLFGGKVKNPKVLQDLQMEAEALARYISKLEDDQLEAMLASEAANEALEAAEKVYQQAKATAIEENASLLGEKTKLEDDLERFLREKEAVLKPIPPKSMQLYENLRKSKRGAAVAAISDGGCSACGQNLTPADLQSVRVSNSLVYCPSCGRILFSS
jgi:predicted  nucleic acid-binding Zn-ribbon protein